MLKKIFLLLFFASLFGSCSDTPTDPPPPKPVEQINDGKASPPIEQFYPTPSKSQLEWQNADLIMFIHFSMNTFTDLEWGFGNEDPRIFNPTHLDAEQWVQTAKNAGFTYIILTAKHHDGFCLWPSRYTEHSIKNSPYKNGKGDIVKEFSDACNKHGVKFCLYLSPWDRHEPSYGTMAYNTFYQNQLTELLTKYGTVSEVWLDGANGEGSEGKKQIYDWDLYFSTIRFYQPNAIIAAFGPDVRWIGNEKGIGNETEWCALERVYSMQHGAYDNRVWYPSQCDVSIRPGWFYHASEDQQVKSLEKLIEIYFKSVGRNSNMLLNIPPNREGLFSQWDIQRLNEWKRKLDEIFAEDLFKGQTVTASNTRLNAAAFSPTNCVDDNLQTFWVTERDTLRANLTITLPAAKEINIIRIEEAIEYGQRIRSFGIECSINGKMVSVFEGTTIGRSRIVCFPKVITDKINIVIKDSYSSPTLRSIKGFYSSYMEHFSGL